MRTVVLTAGILLVGALAIFLSIGKWKNPLNLKELPKRLGLDIQQDARGYTFDHAFGAHSRYKIHASKVVQFKQGNAVLHDVKIELYEEDGSRVDRIEGDEFEYDKNKGTATSVGPVEITLMRPGATAAAIAPKAAAGKPKADAGKPKADAGKPKADAGEKTKGTPLAAAAATAATGEIHVKTSGLTFDQKSGVATTDRHVEFSMVQGAGSSMGATFDSQQGHLVLDRAVELTTERGGSPVLIHALHAEFERGERICRLHAATAHSRGGDATAGDAKILFREDGSAARLDAVNGFTLATAAGGHVAAPTGSMDFDEHNQPRYGHLQGGVRMDSVSQTGNGSLRRIHGTAPTADLEFTSQGELRHSHMERGVEMHSEELSEFPAGGGGPLRLSRTWRSPLADMEFRDAGHGQVEPASIHGVQGVVVTGESQRGKEAPVPSQLAADELTGRFGPGSVLTGMTGTGHAAMEETTATGILQTSNGDRIEVYFVPDRPHAAGAVAARPDAARPGAAIPGAAGADQARADAGKAESSGAAQIQSAVLDGHVVLTQVPAPKPGQQAEAPMRATAGRAVYDGAGQWLHLTLSPRVEDGGLQLTADKIDVSHESGDGFAHGNVKATWLETKLNTEPTTSRDTGTTKAGAPVRSANGTASQGSMGLGGQGPAHVIAAEAQLHQATGEATFRGHARLWQQANSVAGPVIVLDRQRQTLVARSTDPNEPVRAVLLSAGGLEPATSKQAGSDSGKSSAAKPATPSVIRVRGGDLKYSDAERRAVMRGGALGTVVAETGTATSVSNEVELTLLPAGNHAAKDGGQAQVDRMTARGSVTVSSEGRRGTGEQLVYSSETGEYVLTGTSTAPPHMVDPARGNTTGEALIFHSRDESVSAEGGGRKTTTETRTPK
jgi:lipopolysaccharide export system protein LptA